MHEREREVTLLDRLLQGDDRRRPAAPDRGVERRAQRARATGYPFVVLDPRHPARRADPVGLGRAHWPAPKAGDRASALARAPPDRRDHGPARLGRDRGSPTATRRRSPRPASWPTRSSRPRPTSRIERGETPPRPARPPRAPDRDLRVQRRDGRRRDPPARDAGSACPTTSRSSASTTSRTRRSSRRHRARSPQPADVAYPGAGYPPSVSQSAADLCRPSPPGRRARFDVSVSAHYGPLKSKR